MDSNIIEKYSDCFGDFGTIPLEYHITVKENVDPVIMPPRKVPMALRTRLKAELDRMVQNEIIAPVQEPTDWVNSLVIIEKSNGKLRVCLDPRPLNKAIKREHFQIPTTEESLSQMSDARYFSKLDASQGYWHLRVDDESSKLLTFATPFGRFRYKRLPYGIRSASEIFQVEIANLLSGIDGTAHSQDDIIIWASSTEDHDRRLGQVMFNIQKTGLKLNKSKCGFGVKEILFLGHIVSQYTLENLVIICQKLQHL